MKISFEPSGTHVHKDYLKIRLDLYPDVADKTYQLHHVFVVDETSPEFQAGYKGEVDEFGSPVDPVDYQNWIDSLPHIWRVNPCLCMFLTVPETIKPQDVDLWLEQKLKPDDLKTLDESLILPNSAHLISPFMRQRLIVAREKIKTPDVPGLITAVNKKFEGFERGKKPGGEVIPVRPKTIDIGAGAIERLSFAITTITLLCTDTPANADGTIDTWQIWAYSDMTGCKVGTFFYTNVSDIWECRDFEDIGNVASGSLQPFPGLSTAVGTSDRCAGYTATGGWERDTSGYGDIQHKGSAGDVLTVGLQTNFASYLLGDAISLHGTGTEAGGGWANIAKVSGVASAGIAKMNSVVVANIAKVNGVAV